MRPTLQDPKSPPSKARAPVTPGEPSPELVAHFSSPKTRKRLLGHLKWRLVPERNREDVVSTTLTDAWKQRHTWPKTVEQLDKLLFTILRCDRVDAARKERKEPLLRGEPGEGTTNDDTPSSNADEDPPEPGGITVTTEPHEEREAIDNAMAYADSRPRLKYPMRWLLQMYMGLSAREIARMERVTENVVYLAVSDLRAELRAKFGRVFILLALTALVYAIIHFLYIGRVNDQAHPPQTVPTVVAPPPAPDPAPTPSPRPAQTPPASDKPPR